MLEAQRTFRQQTSTFSVNDHWLITRFHSRILHVVEAVHRIISNRVMFSSIHDGSNSIFILCILQSMLNFLNDPLGEMPWEEEEGSEDVLHLYTQGVSKLRKFLIVLNLSWFFKSTKSASQVCMKTCKSLYWCFPYSFNQYCTLPENIHTHPKEG